MTSQEMMKSTAKPGNWFVNTAAVDATPDWHEQVMPQQQDESKLFGYDARSFMARQYK